MYQVEREEKDGMTPKEEQKLFEAMKQSQSHKKGFYCTDEQIRAMKKQEYERGFNDSVTEASKIVNDLMLINILMFLVDRCDANKDKLEEFLKYIKEMKILRKDGQYKLADNVLEIEEVLGRELFDRKNEWEQKSLKILDSQYWKE